MNPATIEPEDLFAEFNSRFFGGALPEYSIAMMPVTRIGSRELLGECDHLTLTIALSETVFANEEQLREVLIHEMAHAATEVVEGSDDHSHGWRFLAELLRLLRAGAPVNPLEFDEYWGGHFTEGELIERARAAVEPSEFGRVWASMTSQTLRGTPAARHPSKGRSTSPESSAAQRSWPWCGTK